MPDPQPRLDENGYVNLDPHQAAAQAITACTLCDPDGYRHPAHRTVCDHTTRNTTKGRAAVKQTLAQIAAKRHKPTPNNNTDQNPHTPPTCTNQPQN